MILLVFTVIVSIMGTYTVLVSMETPDTILRDGETSPKGNVEFSIIEPPAGPAAVEGEVSLSVTKGGN